MTQDQQFDFNRDPFSDEEIDAFSRRQAYADAPLESPLHPPVTGRETPNGYEYISVGVDDELYAISNDAWEAQVEVFKAANIARGDDAERAEDRARFQCGSFFRPGMPGVKHIDDAL